MQMAALCTRCGTPQKDQARFCENCGLPFVTRRPSKSAAPPAIPAAAPSAPRRAKSGGRFSVRLIVGGLVTLLVSLGLIFLLVSGDDDSPAKAASEFLWALEQGDVENAKGMMSSKLRKLLDDRKFNLVLTRNREVAEQRGGLKSIEVLQEAINQDAAIVQLKLLYGDGYSDEQSIKLVREGDDWKISADK
jgi:uncharacterized membrane protein YvbJ